MLNRFTRRLLHSARVYDLIQLMAGDRRLRRRLEPHLRAFPVDSVLVDMGGGTGLGNRAAAACRYICLDLDLEKLRRFRARSPRGVALAADAIRCPLKTDSVNGVLCAKVTHHLNDAELKAMMAEAARIIGPDGTLVIADALWSSRRLARLLWWCDHGSFPRTADAIRRAIPPGYAVSTWEEFRMAIFHDFVLCTARRRPSAAHAGGGGGRGHLRSRDLSLAISTLAASQTARRTTTRW